MPYGLRYITQAASKSNKMFTAYIYEKDYAGDSEQIAAAYRPFEQNVLASSDDSFDPVLASELMVALDITDFTGTIPDLTTRDDKKYHVVLKAGALPEQNTSTILWKLFQAEFPDYIDSNIIIRVNGLDVVVDYWRNTGTLVVNATDVIEIVNDSFTAPVVIPPSSGYRLQVAEDGTDIYNATSSTFNPSGIQLNYSFVAGYQKVYTVLVESFTPIEYATMPVNTIYDIFQGYILTDATRLSFASGRKFLDLSVSDGIAMLKSIPYLTNYTNTVDINTRQTLLAIILQCLNKLALPDGFGLNIACNIYADAMDESLSGFEQEYYPIHNWMNSDYTFKDCYTVLETICRSFGARIYQANNEYWITSVMDAASGTLRRFKYDQDGTFISLTVDDASKVVKPYLQDRSVDHYFINGDQAKIIRKGYPEVNLKCAASYAPQVIDNGTFRNVTSGVPDNWTVTLGTFGTITQATYNQYTGFEIYAGSTQTYLQPNSVANVYGGDAINLSLVLKAIPVALTPGIQVEIKITNGADQWKWNGTAWLFNFVTGWCDIDITTDAVGSHSITTDPAPSSGSMSIRFRVQSASSSTTAFLANIFLSYSTPYDYRIVKTTTTNDQYKKVVDIVMGGQSGYQNSTQIGALTDGTQTALVGWHRYGITEDYDDLTRLVIEIYINTIIAAQINMEGAIMSIFDSAGPMSIVNTLYFQDTTTTLPATGLPYIMGNMRINYTDDEISGTWLQISDTEITETISDIVVLKV